MKDQNKMNCGANKNLGIKPVVIGFIISQVLWQIFHTYFRYWHWRTEVRHFPAIKPTFFLFFFHILNVLSEETFVRWGFSKVKHYLCDIQSVLLLECQTDPGWSAELDQAMLKISGFQQSPKSSLTQLRTSQNFQTSSQLQILLSSLVTPHSFLPLVAWDFFGMEVQALPCQTLAVTLMLSH